MNLSLIRCFARQIFKQPSPSTRIGACRRGPFKPRAPTPPEALRVCAHGRAASDENREGLTETQKKIESDSLVRCAFVSTYAQLTTYVHSQ
jgi:hypothetical protein